MLLLSLAKPDSRGRLLGRARRALVGDDSTSDAKMESKGPNHTVFFTTEGRSEESALQQDF